MKDWYARKVDAHSIKFKSIILVFRDASIEVVVLQSGNMKVHAIGNNGNHATNSIIMLFAIISVLLRESACANIAICIVILASWFLNYKMYIK